ncbi:MAG: DUF5683 domain-containing protein [Candidatus Marinimicrobia bacterium]|jgi:hypothetical protein|nr:DUF5683 domain-containing protein [Candidatus Neomarinimicrobiota bacterium]MDP6611025.1 DUF5683 domain-containing protein [Candidatus Neomarinimicrobiota bacterium]|tara:strand:+ start:303 stop:716 length:414 start_codon:yes stop_codon:yes gene_type:complete
MIKIAILIIFLAVPIFAQEADSLDRKISQQAAKRAMIFPGGGQFYNGQPLKGGLLIGLAAAAAYLYGDYANKYKNYSGEDMSIKEGFLKQRNKYGWWIGFVYIYGLLDAVVEAHLHPFRSVMDEDLEQLKEKDKEQQ